MLDDALRLYGTRILDNVDLDPLPNPRARVGVAAGTMMERGNARAFAMERRMLDRLQATVG
ncbi:MULTISPECIES: hypothetical protein [unclassified Bradyrhizobium]|uniref:hypothetical protein n=1 Tax=unclassified Bradyrhizobium TaxID=2631580 RepID=UPI0028E8D72A|nr:MULTISPECIES: hypothetical protein [unclassified Bradyrhizobium]